MSADPKISLSFFSPLDALRGVHSSAFFFFFFCLSQCLRPRGVCTINFTFVFKFSRFKTIFTNPVRNSSPTLSLYFFLSERCVQKRHPSSMIFFFFLVFFWLPRCERGLRLMNLAKVECSCLDCVATVMQSPLYIIWGSSITKKSREPWCACTPLLLGVFALFQLISIFSSSLGICLPCNAEKVLCIHNFIHPFFERNKLKLKKKSQNLYQMTLKIHCHKRALYFKSTFFFLAIKSKKKPPSKTYNATRPKTPEKRWQI